MTDYEKLGQFYLGRTCDPVSGVTSSDDLVMYDARDLTTHAFCVGMTGSGKTGLCISLLEEAAIDGVPAICVDPKGDLSNLMLTFPNLRAQDFQPWIDPAEAVRRGMTVPELAQKTADVWKAGLAEWNQPPERIQRFRDAAEVAIYTPGSNAGRSLTVLKSFAAPPEEIRSSPELLREKILSSVSGLLALLQIEADPIGSREHILLSTILDHFWKSGQDVDLALLIRSIQSPPFSRIGFLDVESFYPAPDRFRLAMSLNNLVASPGFAAWMEGEALDVNRLLFTSSGQPRIAIISIAHLSDAERMFFVTILLNEMLAWVRSQQGTASLRAILYMDEIFGYFSPTANPPSKTPMLTLLKQARAYGLGCILATQNPVDLDYRGLANCGTWFIGRLQTDRDRQRLLDGLEGASTVNGNAFERTSISEILTRLGQRVFLMHNIHEDGPVVFQSRWALSFLRGPLGRQQIETLMAPLKGTQLSPMTQHASAAPSSETGRHDARPILPPDIPEAFFPVRGSADRLVYRPALLGQGSVHYVDSKANLDHWDEVTLVCMLGDVVPEDVWAEADEWDEDELPELLPEPADQPVEFLSLPSALLQKKSWRTWETSLKNHLYRNQRMSVCVCPSLREMSRPDETESDFRIRLRHAAREQRDLLVEKLRARYASRFATLDDQIRRAQQKIEREKSQKSQKTLSAAVSIGGSLLGALFGRKLHSSANVSRAGSVIRSASGLSRESEDVRHAEEASSALLQKRDQLQTEVEQAVQEIQDQFDPDLIQLETRDISPRKGDLSVERVILVWLPCLVTRSGGLERAF